MSKLVNLDKVFFYSFLTFNVDLLQKKTNDLNFFFDEIKTKLHSEFEGPNLSQFLS